MLSLSGSTQVISGLAAIAARYEVFLLDQYGVLHNGSEPYHGAVDCLQQLLTLGKTVVLLSNTSKRSCYLAPMLASLGFPTNYRGAITGGEVAYQFLHERREQLKSCALLTSDIEGSVVRRRENNWSLFNGLDVEVAPVESADCLIVEGTEQVCYSADPSEALLTNYRATGKANAAIVEFLQKGVARQLPMLCTNPDVVSVIGSECVVHHMGGGIAKLYETMGGTVEYFGKPRREHFEVCLELAGVTDKTRVVHVGDSLHHDVQGAVNTGVDSIFIAGGIHAPELDVNAWSDDDEQQRVKPALLDNLLDGAQLFPTYACTRFAW